MSLIDPTALSSSGPLSRSFVAPASPFDLVRDAARGRMPAPPYSQTSVLTLLLAVDVAAAFDTAAIGLSPLAWTVERIELLAALVAICSVVATVLIGGFSRSILFSPGRQAWTGLLGGVLAILCMTAALGLTGFDQDKIIRVAIALLPLPVAKAAIRFLAACILVNDPDRRLAPRAAILGGGEHADLLIAALHEDLPRLRLLGIVDDDEVGVAIPTPYSCAPQTHGTLRYLGSVETVFSMIREGFVDAVIVAMPATAERRALALVRRLRDYPVQVRMAPGLMAFQFAGSGRTRVGGVDLIHAADRPIQGWRNVAKRGADIAVSLFALVVLAVPMALVAALIRLDSPGPVLFRQDRTGFNDRPFRILKFRTMRHSASAGRGFRQASLDDPRVTRVGRVLRRTSLDELPQFLNVLVGDMSVIGPRPHVCGAPSGQRSYEDVVTRYAARHRVLPGITGLAQVRGLRGETNTEDALKDRVHSDIEYIETWTFWRDLAILGRTVVTVLSMRNAR